MKLKVPIYRKMYFKSFGESNLPPNLKFNFFSDFDIKKTYRQYDSNK